MLTSAAAAPPHAQPRTVAQLAVEYEGVSFAYSSPDGSPRAVLQNVSLSVRAGERLGILGPNGGGKSTLLKLTLGLLRPQDGRIRVFGLSPDEARRRRQIGYVPQRIESELAFPLSVRQVVQMGISLAASPWSFSGSAGRAAAHEALDLVGAASLADRSIGKLSGGQLQRVMIARAL